MCIRDRWSALPPSTFHALAGATVIANLSASDETVGKAEYRRALVSNQSARLLCGYLYASAGHGESTQDLSLIHIFIGLIPFCVVYLSINHSFKKCKRRSLRSIMQ